MARIRCIKPEFWSSESVGRLSRDARLLFVGLWSQADDEGRFRAHPRLLAAELFPYDEDAVPALPTWLAELSREGCVDLYEVDGSAYGVIPRWLAHQKIDHPAKSKLPDPSLGKPREEFAKPREHSGEDQGSGIRDQGMDQGPGIFAGKKRPRKSAGRKSAPGKPPPDPRHAPLLKAIDAAFLEATGEHYDWSGRGPKDLQRLLAEHEPDAIEARYRRALLSTHPVVRELGDFHRRWNHFAADDPQPRMPKDLTRGTVRAESQEHMEGLPF